VALLNPQQKHKLWINSQVHGRLYHRPLYFIDTHSDKKIYVFTRTDDGIGNSIIIRNDDICENKNSNIDELISDMELSDNDPVADEILSEMHAEYCVDEFESFADFTEQIEWKNFRYNLLEKNFKKLIKEQSPDFSKIYGTRAAAEATCEFLKKVAKWGDPIDFCGNYVFLKKYKEGSLAWEVSWEDGPHEWATHTSMGRLVPWGCGDQFIELMNVTAGPNWYTEANYSFSLVFFPTKPAIVK